MDIAQYISDLLKEHQEVGLPEIGTFSKEDVSARLLDGVFFPPSEQVTFSSDRGSQSALLVNHIVVEKNISESSAIYFIERFCANLKDNLRKGDKVEVLPLGYLSESESNYNFEALEHWPAKGSFGLSPVTETELKSPSVHVAEINTSAPAQNAKIISENVELEEAAPASRGKGIWITIALLLIVGAVAGALYVTNPQYFSRFKKQAGKQPSPKAIAVPVPDTIKQSESFADSILQELEAQGMHGTEVVKTPDTVNVTIAEADTPKPTAQSPAKVYEIIVASFGLQTEAEQAIKTYRKRNIDAKLVIDTKKPKFKVGVGTFTTSEAAHKENRRVQSEMTKDAWVLTIKNQEK